MNYLTTITVLWGISVDASPLISDITNIMRKNLAEETMKMDDVCTFAVNAKNGFIRDLDAFTVKEVREEFQGGGFKLKLTFAYDNLKASWTRSTCVGFDCVVVVKMDGNEFEAEIGADVRCDGGGVFYAVTANISKVEISVNSVNSPQYFPDFALKAGVKAVSEVLNSNVFLREISECLQDGMRSVRMFHGEDVRTICDQVSKLI